MAEATNNKIDMSSVAFELAKEKGFGSDEAKFKEWEKEFVKKFYEVIGLSDIPDEFLNFTKFIDAYSGVLVKSVQNDIAIMSSISSSSGYSWISSFIGEYTLHFSLYSESKP